MMSETLPIASDMLGKHLYRDKYTHPVHSYFVLWLHVVAFNAISINYIA